VKKILFLFLTAGIFSGVAAQSVNVIATLGTTSGSYPTLKGAFDNINNGTHKGAIAISVVASTTETAPAVLNASGTGSASFTTITIKPSGGAAIKISGTLAAPLVDLNGADNVTIDGVNSGGNSLTISNLSATNTSNTSTIRFLSDATNNTIMNTRIEGAETSTSLGVVFFSTGIATTGTGNDGNTLSNNTITSAGGNLPSNAIYSAGTSATIDNSGISILNNSLSDYYNPAVASNGIYLASNSSSWTITGNTFFQTANRTSTAGSIHRAINIITASGTGYNISNNVIGFGNASGIGQTIYDGAFANRFFAIEMTVGSAVASNVQGNTISGISLSTTSGTTAAPGIFTGISILSGNVNVGSTTGNTIGATSGTGSISISSTTTSAYFAGIYATSTGNVNIQNNNIGSISTGGGASIGYTFYGINTAGAAGNFTIASNTVGSATTASSITVGTDPLTTVVCTFNGIANASTGITSITYNTIQNCSVYSSGASAFNGITNSGSTGTLNINSNAIRLGINSGTGNSTCIANTANAGIININSNIIRSQTKTAGSGAFLGISNTGAAASQININNNQLGDSNGGALTFTNASTGNITGIISNGGTATTTVSINNNTLQGFSVVSAGAFIGIINAGSATGNAININNNLLGSSSGGLIVFSGTNSSAFTGISNTGGSSASALTIQGNDFRGIVHSSTGSSTHTYINNTAATLSQNIISNTFTNINANTTGAILFIADNVVVSGSGVQNVNSNSISGTYSRNASAISGVLTLFNSSASSVSGAVINNNNNNFSNITVSGSSSIAGWLNTDAGSGSKTIQGNTFSNWTSTTGSIIGMNVNITGIPNAITGNTISNFSSASGITAITTGAGNDNIYANTISSIISTGAGATMVNGIIVTAGSIKNIYNNVINGLKANYSDIGGGGNPDLLSVNGIWVSGGTTVNLNDNKIYGCTADAISSGTLNGIIISGGTTVSAYRNKIYDLSSNSTAINAGGISAFMVFNKAGSTTNIYNNIIGDLRTPLTNNTDAFRGMTITTTTISNINVYFNTIYLNSTSSGANFGCTGIYHAGSATSGIGLLDLRNNIVSNLSVPKGSGVAAVMRQYQTGLANYASTCNNNLFYAGPPSTSNVIYNDYFSLSDQTLAAFQARLGGRENQSFTEDITADFLTLVSSSASFLHIDTTKCTRLESGAVSISGIADDFDTEIRQGNPGYTGTGTAPDIGADEFEGTSLPSGTISGTALICNGSAATLTLSVKGVGTISGTLSDGSAFSGTAPTINVSVSPATNTTYTIATLSNSKCTSLTSDRKGSAVITINARPTGAISGTQAICNGSSANLTLSVTGTGTLSGTLSDGTSFSGTAPTIIVSVSPATATTYNIAALTNGTCASIAADRTGSATVTVNSLPAAPTAAVTAQPTCTVATGTITITAPTSGGMTYSTNGSTYTNTTGIFSGMSAGSYNLTAQNSSGCISSTTAVTVNAQPATPAGALAGTTSICLGNSATLSITATGPGTISGTLSDGTPFSGTAPIITVGVQPLATRSYTIATLTNGTCTSAPADKTGGATITVTTPPSATISYASPFCSNIGIGTVTLTGTTGGNFIAPGASINSANGTVDLVATPPGLYTVTYMIAATGGCPSSNVSSSIIINPNTWTGGINTDWNTPGNWVSNAVPALSCPDVTILAGVPYQPTLGSGSFAIQNMYIKPGAYLTIKNATLQISGTINNAGTFDVSNGTIEMNGSSAQTIPANAFVNNALNNLIISNSSAAGVTLNGALDIYGSLTYTGAGRIFSTNDYLTIKSTAAATAWVGDLTGNTITGKVTVERYIAAHKAWHFLAVPTNTTQTIKQTWQEGAVNLGSNPVPGFGTEITSNRSTWASDGFDTSSLNPSVKKYNAVTNAWVGVANTNVLDIKATDGYCIFVRGDRLATGLSSPATQTVLRTTGNLYVGDQPAIAVPANQFMAIGNPYASAIDMRNITKTGLKDFFYVWDPQLAGFYGYGGYQTFSSDGSGNYVVTPGSGSFGTSGSVSNYIKSGLAFFVQATAAGGSITFKEAAKGNSAGQANTPASLPWPQLRANVYGISPDKTVYMADGLLINYGDNFSNGVDSMDALKSYNTSENLSVKTGGTLLVVERRHTIVKSDTIFLNLTGVKAQGYRFEFMATGIYQPGLNGFLEDTYLKTRTPLNIDGTTTADFSIVNIAGSYAANRFRIVFTPQAILPVTFTSLKAYPVASKIAVEWKVDNETNINQYVVEKSLDGTSFNKLATTPATANGGHSASYQVTDSIPADSYNYYRVKSIDISGKTAYSDVVEVLITKANPQITVYPNHIIAGMINLHFINQQAGTYFARLTNTAGQLIIDKEINHMGGNNDYQIQFNRDVSHGVYHLEIIKNNASPQTIKVLY
jgi:hypothetical protein